MTGKKSPTIILASASPRRKELMRQAGYKFRVVVANIDESAIAKGITDSVEYVKHLALAKTSQVAKKFPDCLVIGADTIVDYEGEIIGKAEDENHAAEITAKLFSRPHKVITGLAIVRLANGIEVVETDTTIVYPRKMTQAQLEKHIKGGTWKGKAGAYGIQETGDEFVERIDGSFTNVMGMPMELLAAMLKPILTTN